MFNTKLADLTEWGSGRKTRKIDKWTKSNIVYMRKVTFSRSWLSSPLLPPANEVWGQGNIFTSISDSIFYRGDGGVSNSGFRGVCLTHIPLDTHPWTHTPWTPPGHTHTPHGQQADRTHPTGMVSCWISGSTSVIKWLAFVIRKSQSKIDFHKPFSLSLNI